MGLFNLFQKKEDKFDYYKFKRELDIEHDKTVEYFAELSRQYDRNREEVNKVADWSMRCFRIVMTLSQKGMINRELATDYMMQEGWTAYLPIEVGPVLKQIWSSDDAVLIHELYKQ